jgi:hypothetical protein
MKNLNYVVNLVQMDMRDFSSHNVPYILQYCIHAYKSELRFETNKAVKVAYLQLNDVNNAPWPKDYEYYTKVAINWGGQYITLTRNNNIPLQRKFDDCGNPSLPDIIVNERLLDPFLYSYGYYFAPHYRNGQYVGEMYSMGGGYNEAGYFREDHEMRQFQFYNVPQREVVLEYVADLDATGETMIPFSAVEPIRQYALWQMVEHDRRVPVYDRQRAQDRYRYAIANYSYISWTWTAEDYMDACYATTKSGPKR